MKRFLDFFIEEIDEDLIAQANKTARAAGAVSAKALVPRYVKSNVDKDASILDFGSGGAAKHTMMLRDEGFTNVTAYDFGSNVIEGVHDKGALSKQFDVVFASNVINVQGSDEMLDNTLSQIAGSVNGKGIAIFNFPEQPRYGAWNFNNQLRKDTEADNSVKRQARLDDIAKLEEYMGKHFGSFKRVGGSKTAPIYEASK